MLNIKLKKTRYPTRQRRAAREKNAPSWPFWTSLPAILRHSAPPCYIIEITDCPAPDFRPTDHVFHKLSSQIPANIGNSASSAFSWIRLPRLTAATSRSTCSDLMAPAGISQGAHGTTWVAGISLESIRRRTIL